MKKLQTHFEFFIIYSKIQLKLNELHALITIGKYFLIYFFLIKFENLKPNANMSAEAEEASERQSKR